MDIQVFGQLKEAMGHLAFAIILCQRQAAAGRKYVLVQPARAISWGTNVMAQLLKDLDCIKLEFDFCMSGMISYDMWGTAPARKRIRIATNSRGLASTLEKLQCDGGHRHAQLIGGKAKRCD